MTNTINLNEFYKDKNILITGGLGFIGSNLVIKLVELGSNVTIMDSLIPDFGGSFYNISSVTGKVKVDISDMRDSHSLEKLVPEKDIIFNLAGQVSHEDGMVDPVMDLDINAKSQLYLLEAVRKSNPRAKIVYAGTRQIYGKIENTPVNELHLVRPSDTNGVSKFAGEWYHILYNQVYGIPTTSLRLTNTFGPRQLMKHARQGFIPYFIKLALDDQEIPIYGDGTQIRDMNYIDDVVEAFLLAGSSNKSDGQYYNLGGIIPITLLDFVKELITSAGSGKYQLVPFPVDRKKIDIGDYVGDFSKIKRELGWEPKIGIVEGIKKTVEYYKANKKYYW
ncbi:NAD-dependent epimerase [candidate division WWE3 bacterium CG08_land_8_20_14_0_20_40_13]|uniref:NAD-dependent epimerase n=1 Tax=candidate division WWE3 bacterium CG08_land_8_20_14_0_20_40_13 TaxID=1975084 RepID=A0A2H0XEA0_UNCKA|nr:MAG: NAD-dependent epimerase [candidate division WWE3 bacterium CG08_land_8_20_14_0_20_40_13]